jgi:alpha-1,2-mannosyltransferase
MTRVAQVLVRTTTIVVCAFLPAVALWSIFDNVAQGGSVTDFDHVFYPAGEALLAGGDLYPSSLDDPVIAAGKAYVYPPLTAILSAPLTLLSLEVAGYVTMALLAAAVVLTLLVLDVRDWRCYGVVFIWPPILSAIQIGTITVPLGLCAAIAWRFRDRAYTSGVALGISLAAKIILWPLLLWQGATARVRSLVVALAAAVALVVASWAVVGFEGLAGYFSLLRRLQELEETQGYTVYALAVDVGVASPVARILGLAVAATLLVAVVVVGRRGDDRRAFALAIGAALAVSPIVWLHYFALLMVVTAVTTPRIGPVWFVPLLFYASKGTGNGTTLQTAATLAAAALTIAVALRTDARARPRMLASPAALPGRPG